MKEEVVEQKNEEGTEFHWKPNTRVDGAATIRAP